MPTTIRLDFRVLLYREEKWWIAHCLDMDLAAEGDTREEAIDSLVGLIDVQVTAAVEEGDLQSIFSSAPADLWRLYAIAQDPPKKKRRSPESAHSLDLSVREMTMS